MKPKKRKLNKKQMYWVRHYWNNLQKIQEDYWSKVNIVEACMAEDTGIPDIEFIWVNNAIIGVGNVSKTIELIQTDEMEK